MSRQADAACAWAQAVAALSWTATTTTPITYHLLSLCFWATKTELGPFLLEPGQTMPGQNTCCVVYPEQHCASRRRGRTGLETDPWAETLACLQWFWAGFLCETGGEKTFLNPKPYSLCSILRQTFEPERFF